MAKSGICGSESSSPHCPRSGFCFLKNTPTLLQWASGEVGPSQETRCVRQHPSLCPDLMGLRTTPDPVSFRRERGRERSKLPPIKHAAFSRELPSQVPTAPSSAPNPASCHLSSGFQQHTPPRTVPWPGASPQQLLK